MAFAGGFFVPSISAAIKAGLKAFGKWAKKAKKKKMLKAGQLPDQGNLTASGRALQKHGNRPGSAFPVAKGNPAAMSAQGQNVLEGIVNHPDAVITSRHHARFGNITEIRVPGGPGARFSGDCSKLIGFMEP